MKQTRAILAAFMAAAVVMLAATAASTEEYHKIHGPIVVMETSLGTVEMEVCDHAAPLSAANFLRYVNEHFYDGLVFHRVIAGFMIQGGGLTPDLTEKPTHEPVQNEAKGGKPNRRGTVALARTNDIDSATSQFFINLRDNFALDYKGDSPQDYGYTVFAQVVSGMDVVDRIAQVETHSVNGMNDVPVEPVLIKRMWVKGAAPAP